MFKIIKNLSSMIGVSALCLASSFFAASVVQAGTPAASPSDFEDSSELPEAPMPCIEGENCPSSGGSATTPVEPPSVATTVSCENLATVVRKGDKSAVLITWKTTEFGGNYTPQQRCNVVSSRFSAKVQANNGSLKGLLLSNGPVNSRMVICALRPGEYECSAENMLFTLKKENERNAGAVLGRLLNISVTGSGSAIEENSGQQVKVDMGKWAANNLRRTGRASNINPNSRPVPTAPSKRPPTNTGF